MTYVLIDLPLSKPFREMTKAECRSYFQWFTKQIETRIGILESEVNSATGWRADYSPQSLATLQSWFALQVGRRPLTDRERQIVEQADVDPLLAVDSLLTELSYSLCTDIGMYFGETIIRVASKGKWDLELGSRNNLDYGKPIITGLLPGPINPVDVVETVAHAVTRGKTNPKSLRQLCENWKSIATGDT